MNGVAGGKHWWVERHDGTEAFKGKETSGRLVYHGI